MNKSLVKANTCCFFQASWADINFLYQHKWINCEEVKKYADSLFLKDNLPSLSNLLWAKNDTFDFCEELVKLAGSESCNLEKVSLIGLCDIWQSKKQFRETQNLIEELYCDCDHQKLLAQFVSYMPVERVGDFFLEENYERKIQEFMENLKLPQEVIIETQCASF